jgi:hypothetical protein
MTSDVFSDPKDQVEVEPPELGPFLVAVLTSSLAKRLAAERTKPWTHARETELQEKISALVAEARTLKLTTIRIIVVKPSGQRITRDLSVDRISKERKLQ